MQHAGNAHVVNVIVFSGHLARQIGAFDPFADDFIVFRVLWFYLGRDLHVPAAAAGSNPGVKFFAADQLAIGDAFCRISGNAHNAIDNGQFFQGRAQLCGGEFQ